MDRRDLVKSVVEQTGVRTPEVQKVLEAAFERLSAELETGNNVTLRGIGSFRIRQAQDGVRNVVIFRKAEQAKPVISP